MTPHTVDRLCVLAGAIVPVLLIVRWKTLGFAIGTLFVWFIGILTGVLLSEMDPGRGTPVTDGVWLLFGWGGGLIYCTPIWIVRMRLVRSGMTRQVG